MGAFSDVGDLRVRALGLFLVSPALAQCVASVVITDNTSALVATLGKVRLARPHALPAWVARVDVPGVVEGVYDGALNA